LVSLPYMTTPVHLRFDADHRRLAGFVQDGDLGIWEIADGREYQTLTHHANSPTAGYRSVAVSPEGRLVAVTIRGGIGLWDLAAGSQLAFLPMEQPLFVQFDRQGALLTC